MKENITEEETIKKRILSLLSTLTLCMSLAVPAFAAGTTVSLPQFPEYPKTTFALTNVQDTYTISMVGSYWDNTAGSIAFVEETHPVYRLATTGSMLKYNIGEVAAFFYPGITDLHLPQDGKYTSLTEGYGQVTHMTGPVSGEYEMAQDLYVSGEPYIYEMCIMADGAHSLVFYFTYEDLSAYEVKEEQPAPAAPAFSDVPSTAYYYEPVKWAVTNGITNGTTDTTFAPGNTCTNAHILTFMWRAAGSPEPAGSNPFTSVTGSEYYAKAAMWAHEKGMISGTSFDSGKACTRAMTMEYFWKQAGSPKTEISDKFTDVTAGDSYAQAVAWAVANGVTTGVTKSTFVPDKTCTRGQIVTFLYRALV